VDACDPALCAGDGDTRGGRAHFLRGSRPRARLRGIELAGADIVEVSPPYDGPGAITGVLAANLLFELLSVVALAR